MTSSTVHATSEKRKNKCFILLTTWACLSALIFTGYVSNLFTIITSYSITLFAREQHETPWMKYAPNSSTADIDECRAFNNKPWEQSIAKYFWKEATINCKSGVPNLLLVEKGTYLKLKINWSKAKSRKLAVDYCRYASLRRQGDFNVVTSPWSKTFTESITIPDDVEHILGQCLYKGNVIGHGYLSIIRENSAQEAIHEKNYKNHVDKNKPKETLSVLLIGIDGTSKNNFARQMPRTKWFMENKMRSIELYRLNKVGLNTLPNVLPLLTGQPSSRVRQMWTDKEYLDKIDHLFLWDEARRAGYRTSAIFDRIRITSFHYLKKGWKNPKFDFYYRPVVVKSEKDKITHRQSIHCQGDTPEVIQFYDYWLQLARFYSNTTTRPYFGYSFFAKLTHNLINEASRGDELYLNLFQTLVEQNLLNNTLILFFSDHGCRYGTFRFTYRGMQEDNNPFMFFIFPPWFKSKYPKIMANFYKNQHRLVTNFDVYATLKDILYFKGDDIATRITNKTFGISLFQELPVKRTCEEANIPLKYCNCRNHTGMQVKSDLSVRVSNHFLEYINKWTEKVRDKCVLLTLNSTINVLNIVTTSKTDNFYHTTIMTSPGGAVYEATLKSPKASDTRISVTGDVGRINMYRGQADCVSDARMRPFCYCKNML